MFIVILLNYCFVDISPDELLLFFYYFSISVFVSTWRADDTSSKQMFDNIAQSLDQMKQLAVSCDTAKL